MLNFEDSPGFCSCGSGVPGFRGFVGLLAFGALVFRGVGLSGLWDFGALRNFAFCFGFCGGILYPSCTLPATCPKLFAVGLA